jgi:NitT/TauT family transport system substrate-binding protein
MKPRCEKSGHRLSRRRFAAAASAAGAASVLCPPRAWAAEAAPEVKRIRLPHTAAICLAPQYVAEELLQLEGFSTVEYVDVPYTGSSGLTTGRADVTIDYVPSFVWSLDAGSRIVALAPGVDWRFLNQIKKELKA